MPRRGARSLERICDQSVIIAACAWERATGTSVGGLLLFQLGPSYGLEDNYLLRRLVVDVNSITN